MFLGVLMIHVLTVSVFVGTAVMIDLRLLGRTMTHVPASQVIARLLPWSEAGFVVMVVTGTLLFYASPLARYREHVLPHENGGARDGAHQRLAVPPDGVSPGR